MNYCSSAGADGLFWDDVKEGKTVWTGVRNFQARNNLRSMKAGDRVLFYHSVTDKAIIGEAEVLREAFADPTATGGNCSRRAKTAEAATPASLTRGNQSRQET